VHLSTCGDVDNAVGAQSCVAHDPVRVEGVR
jgi:hypothetical protein